MSQRLDMLLLELGLATTRTKAQDLIASGKVLVNGKPCLRAGEKLEPSTNEITLNEKEHPYVSRGGVKLAGALEKFKVSPSGLRVLDVGQSTGGFTDCLLRMGAASVVGVDVGTDQLAPTLRADARVKAFEKQDIRTLDPALVTPLFPFFVVDLSFISLALVMPHLPKFLAPGAHGIVLVKPQFEVGREKVGSGGIVRDAAARERAVRDSRLRCEENGFTVAGEISSPLIGGDGNQETLLHLVKV
jgi:23S rRNA (cytidine1920-2'-O)/16S rRNA (cytidine1409-2'-O)-methyltransferase